MIVRGEYITHYEEEYVFKFLESELGREPTDEEMSEFIEFQMDQAYDKYYDTMEAELKGN